MSICAQIRECVQLGELHQLLPMLDSDPVERKVFISTEIKDALEGPWPNKTAERRLRELQGDLEAFVKGDIIGMCLTAFQHKTAYMGRLDMPKDEVWDIRSRRNSPALRVFGRFASVDTFIALRIRPRSVRVNWLNSEPLGGAESREWQFAIIETLQEWNRLLPNFNPPHGDDLSVYVSNKRFLI
jgi:hypothetical protein